jgi:hypothetical protein
MSDSMQFAKTPGVPGLSNHFDKKGGPDGVKPPIYTQDSGRMNADKREGSAGGEIKFDEIHRNAGRLSRLELPTK